MPQEIEFTAPAGHVVVTGGSGFIGTQLCAELCADPAIELVTVLDRQAPRFSHPKLAYAATDLRQVIEYTPATTPRSIFHLAAACREPGFEWEEYFDHNFRATREVARWATRAGIRNIVFTSTAMVFRACESRRGEEDLPDADTAYGISKALAEEVLRGWGAAQPDRRLRIVRPGVVFGKGAGGNFVNLHRALRRGLFAFVGRRDTVKSAIYVKDLVSLLRTLELDLGPYDTYHGAYLEPTTIGGVCAAFLEVYGWRRWLPVVPFRLAWWAAALFEMLDHLGFRNPVHTRRIEKLFHSTNLAADRLVAINFRHLYSLSDALADWRRECAPADIS